MSLFDEVTLELISFEKSPAKLSSILSSYLTVESNFIISYLTEYAIKSVMMWADDNMLSASDMLDVIQRNLDSAVDIVVYYDDYVNSRPFLNSKLVLTDDGRSYTLSLKWYLGD